MFRVTCYFVEREIENTPRFLIYARSIKVDTNSYISRVINEEEECIPFAQAENGPPWVSIKLIIKNTYQTFGQHEELLKSLRAGRFEPRLIGSIGNCSEFPVIPRPVVTQFDAETLRHIKAPLPPESGISVLSRVESFWPEKKGNILEKALDPMQENPTGIQKAEDEIQLLSLLSERELNSRLQLLVDELKRHTGLSFDDAYAERLCNIEFVDIPFEAHISDIPITIDLEREENKDKQKEPSVRGIRIHRDHPLVDQDLWVNIVLRNNSEVLLDTIVQLTKGQEKSDAIKTEEEISEYEVKIFDPSLENRLIFAQSRVLLRLIQVTLLSQYGTKTYRDQLSEKLNKARINAGERLEAASPFNPSSISVGGHSLDPWVSDAQSLRRFINIHTSQSKTSKWFSRGLQEQGEAVSYIRELIDNPDNHEVLIVDPFFGVFAFEPIIPRLRHATLQVTVITSCLGWDPDVEERRAESAVWEEESRKQREKIANWCSKNISLIATNLRIIDIRSGKEQAFHDRYLAIVNNKGEVSVYSLSNSLNKMASKYPFCITLLDQAAALEVFTYLRGLEIGRDLAVKDSIDSKKLKMKIIWDSKGARENVRAQRTQRLESIYLFKEGPSEFPFWQDTIAWLLKNQSISPFQRFVKLLRSMYSLLRTNEYKQKQLINYAIENNLILRSDRTGTEWHIKVPDFLSILEPAWNKLPNEGSVQATLMAGLGELLAHAHGAHGILPKIVEIKIRKKIDTTVILDHLKKQYAELHSPAGFNNVPASVEELSAEYYFCVEDHGEKRPSFNLLSTAQNYIRGHHRFMVYGMYGLKWTIQLMLMIDPESVISWANQKPRHNTHVYAATLDALIDDLMYNQKDLLLDNLLKSKNPFLNMIGVAMLFGDGQGYYKKTHERKTAILKLRYVGIPIEDILWMSALRIPDAQATEFRSLNLPNEDQKKISAKNALDDLLNELASLLSQANPDDFQLNQLNQALRSSARDRFRVASKAGEFAKDKGIEHGPWEKLYEQCVNDVEILIGKQGENSFYFYAPTDYDKLDVGAQSFVCLNRGRVAKRFRNRLQGYLENLIIVASEPLAYNRDYSVWSESVGRAASGCLFGFLVCQYAWNYGDKDGVPEMITQLVEMVCQLQLGIRGEWNDLAGLLDRLANETAWSIASLGDEHAIGVAQRAVDDERLTSFFRACLAIVPVSVFKCNPERAFKLLYSFTNQEEKQNIQRYFYLLDFIIGNSHKIHLDQQRIDDAVSQGLRTFKDIDPRWQEFFRYVWDALSGDADKKKQILSNEPTKQSYCAMLLEKEE